MAAISQNWRRSPQVGVSANFFALECGSRAWFLSTWTPALQFERTTATCTTILEAHYPSSELLQTESGRAEMIAAICICAEQTFSEASAQTEAFAAAFSTAFNAYVTSTVRDEVNGKIAGLPPQDDEAERDALVDIIKTHRLRIGTKPA
ncbi:hypothetical protein C8R44DRAFT_870504 [Mycena epipterygia]|nr:hypothetical protein C8R44DRAFT_870504 [Mycena epipterygia]